MESPSLIALSRADVLSRQMDMVANNIANSTTTGFKTEQMLFKTERLEPARNQPLDFVSDRSTYRNLASGPIMQTGNPLDVAITGPGYLAIRDQTGQTVYTRAGNMKIDANGTMVDMQGNPMLSDGGDVIAIPENATSINIGADGTVSSRETGILGKLQLSEFQNAQKLIPTGNGYYKAEGAAPTPAAETQVTQGAIEGSNVQPVLEMTQMMEVTRQYQSVQNILSQEHDRIRNAIRTLGRVA